MGQLITKAELSRRAGLSKSAVSQALKAGLGKALTGDLIDSGHPMAVRFIQRGQRKRAKYDAGAPKPGLGVAQVNPDATPAPENVQLSDEQVQDILAALPPDIRKLQDLSLRELVGMFGTDEAFNKFLEATKKIEAIHELRLKNETIEGKLVARDLVVRGVIIPFDNLLKRLLSDGSRTIARQVSAMSLAGRSVDDCEKYVSERLSSFSRGVKARAKKALREEK